MRVLCLSANLELALLRSAVLAMHGIQVDVARSKKEAERLLEENTYDAGLLCHVGYVIDGQPYVTPTAHWREGDHLYWHGSSASRMLRAQGVGVPVCVTVSLLDGIVLARSGFHHSMNYRSVMALGTAEPVEAPEAKLAALQGFA